MKRVNQSFLLFAMLILISPLFGQDLKFKTPGLFRDTLIVKDTVELTCSNLINRETTTLIKNDSISVIASIDAFMFELKSKIDKHRLFGKQLNR